MNKDTLDAAEREAKEFLRRVKVLKADEYSMRWMDFTGSPLTASVRRQSMELTRALSQMRRVR